MKILFLKFDYSAFTQLLQQTGVFNQLRQTNRPYTLFIPTNAALQSIGITNDVNRLRQVILFTRFLFVSYPFIDDLVRYASYLCGYTSRSDK